jgi:protein involved in polysaccharide export with SLBB domain
MRFLRRFLVALGAVAALSAVLASAPVPAQAPSPQQIELLKSLSPSDRATLMEQLGISSESMGTPGETPKPAVPGAVDADVRSDAAREASLERARKALTFQPEDTVLVEIEPAKPEDPAAAAAALPIDPADQVFMDSVLRRNPYQLDRAAALQLPGLDPIALGGLSEQQANRRLAADPSLRGFATKVTRLPVARTGLAGLKPFGYDLFNDSPSTFAPLSDVPVPADYTLGAGDQLTVQLFGAQNRTLRLVVGRDGRVNFPELGPVPVAGKKFDAVREDIEARVARQMIGTQVSVGMGDTRSISVFVVGEASKPGSYTVSGLSTITSALYASGGIKTTGSLRDIQLKRRGTVVRRLDLYDLLLRGDTTHDGKLQAGDVIFIPPVGPTAAVDGEVRRPAVYELRGNTPLSALISLAGGLTPDADERRVTVVRRGEDQRLVALDFPQNTQAGRGEKLRNGDSIRVARVRPTLDAGVTLDGHVYRAGAVAWREGLRLTQLIPSVDELKPNADLGYVLIRREMPQDRRLVVLSADLGAALRNPGGEADVRLAARDRVIVFDAASSRRQVLDPLLTDLRRQSAIESPTEIVSIGGRVKAPGEYPLEPGMRISDLLRAGGQLDDAAFGAKAELTRFRSTGGERASELLEIDLAAVRRGDPAADVTLQAFDTLTIKELPEWGKQESIILRGEVRFPGTYPIRRGETLRSVLERAGGLTSLAFAQGSVFTRRELMEREQQQIDRLTERLQGDLAATSIQLSQAAQTAQTAQSVASAQGLLGQLKGSKAMGRLVIDLEGVLAGSIGARSDVLLRDGDQLVIPRLRQEVTVLGEVQNGTSHLYKAGLTRDDYVALSGGLSRKADKGRVYVVRANGSVVGASNGWFGRSGQVGIQPGDTIVAPLDTERLPPLPLWQAVTSIIYNVAIAVAAVGSL